MSDWKWLMFSMPDQVVVSHAARGPVIDAVVGELAVRGASLEQTDALPKLNIDQPGMICTTRPIEEFDFYSLRLEIPSEDIASFVMQLEKLKPRVYGGVEFYKLHGFWRALCLSIGEHGNLLVMLRNRLPIAEKRAAEFYAVNKLPSEVLREAAAASTGQSLENIPNLGGNKNDRFKPKGGGQA